METLFRLVETRLRLLETRFRLAQTRFRLVRTRLANAQKLSASLRLCCAYVGQYLPKLGFGNPDGKTSERLPCDSQSLYGRPPWGHVALMLSHMGCQKAGFASPDIRKSYVGLQNSPEQPTCHPPQKPKGLHGRHLYVGPYELPKIGFVNFDVRKSYIGVQNGPHVMLRKGPKASIAGISGHVASMLGHMSCQ